MFYQAKDDQENLKTVFLRNLFSRISQIDFFSREFSFAKSRVIRENRENREISDIKVVTTEPRKISKNLTFY